MTQTAKEFLVEKHYKLWCLCQADSSANELVNALEEYAASTQEGRISLSYQLFKANFIAHADRLLRDRGASNKDVFECLEITFNDLAEYQSSQPRREWVSIDERLPTMPGMYFLKLDGKPAVRFFDGIDFNTDCGNIEWLSEPTAPQEAKQ